MKAIRTVIAALVAVLAVGVLVAGCAGTRIRQLSADEFLREAGRVSEMNSCRWTSYIGSTPQRAYLESGYPALFGGGMRTTVYWVPVADLPGNIVNQLKAGTPPWTNWAPRVNHPMDTQTAR